MNKRYHIEKAHNGLWSIIDMFTGQPAALDGVLMVDLRLLEADDMLFLLNDLPLKFHPVAIRASAASVTPYGAG